MENEQNLSVLKNELKNICEQLAEQMEKIKNVTPEPVPQKVK